MYRALVLVVLTVAAASCNDSSSGKKGTGEPCAHNTDCGDSICHAGVCAAATVNALTNGASCTNKGECRSFVCSESICVPGTSAAGTGCLYNEECVLGSCVGGECSSTAKTDGGVDGQTGCPSCCTDSEQNENETDVNCGGGTCPACANGKSCLLPRDCASNICVQNKCRECNPSATMCQGRKMLTCDQGLWIVPNDECPSGCDPKTQKCRVCPTSTCTSAKIIFRGSNAAKPDQSIEVAIDKNKVYRTSDDADPKIGAENALYGNFTADKGMWATDNVQCCVPTYENRTAIYYLAKMDQLLVDESWYSFAGATGYEDVTQGICCPNYGTTTVSTPKKIQKIEIQPYNGDSTCKVCLYNSSTALDEDHLIRCVSPSISMILEGAELADPAKYPLAIRLDDGSSCGSY